MTNTRNQQLILQKLEGADQQHRTPHFHAVWLSTRNSNRKTEITPEEKPPSSNGGKVRRLLRDERELKIHLAKWYSLPS
ncbi:hypothetical protein [Sediminibacillus sp. JSM 1682029]|uniref:hypothetical protein n=1 Tax=Sediminibacillus sp. JSM 1682029 TaxID=3229857 RepID=UPI003526679D